MNVHPIAFRTQAANKWYHEGRCLLVQVGLASKSVLLLNLYAPSGSGAEEGRQEMYHDLQLEILEWDADRADCRFIVTGDFNDVPFNSSMSAELLLRGWQFPSFDVSGPRCDDKLVTYRSGQSESWLDGFLVSAALAGAILVQTVSWVGFSQHAVVSLEYFSDFSSLGPRVQHPPEVTKGSPFDHSPVDWPGLCSELRLRHRNVEGGQLQAHVDKLWFSFQSAAMRELVACHDIHDGQEGSPLTGNTKLGRPQSFKPKPANEPTPAEDHCLHCLLQVLIHRTQGLRSETFESESLVPPVAELLEIPPSVVHGWLQEPCEGADKLRHEIVLYRNRCTKRALKTWRSRFSSNGFHPSRALFAWLRGKRVRPPLVLQHCGQTCLGHVSFFAALRSYWEGINRVHPTDDSAALKEWLESRTFLQDSPNQDVDAIRTALMNMPVRSAAGMEHGVSELFVCCRMVRSVL
eukprot:6492456-Amphidinium_carterae.1